MRGTGFGSGRLDQRLKSLFRRREDESLISFSFLLIALLLLSHVLFLFLGYTLATGVKPHNKGAHSLSKSTLEEQQCHSPWLPPLESGRKLIFGIGTGRCGTLSLQKLLSLQPNSTVTHEMSPNFPWVSNSCARISRLAAWIEILLRRPKKFTGDIASYYLPYIDDILALYPEAKIICLRRDRSQVIESFSKRAGEQNHWQDPSAYSSSNDQFNPRWHPLFPHFNEAKSREEALGLYWDGYYQRVNQLIQRYGPQTVALVEMNSFFLDQTVQRQVLKWLGYSEPITSITILENQS